MSEQQPFMPEAERTMRARSFAAVATEYERGRPSYPPEAIRWVLGSPPLEVLDLGAGTGKLTVAVLAAGHNVHAVEPLPEMRALLAATASRARVLDGTAERIPLADRCVDAAVVGAAFHWFDQELALDEIERVLRPPSVLGLFGNAFDVSIPWVASLRGILGPPALDRPGHWPSSEMLEERFREVADRAFAHTQCVDRDLLRDLVMSRSAVAAAGERGRERILGEVDELWERHPELTGTREARLGWIARVRRCAGLR